MTTPSQSLSASADPSLDLASLSARYAAGQDTPESVVDRVLRLIEARGDDGVWLARVPAADLQAAARALSRRRAAGESLPLYGLPFAVKDNIDVAGLPTTAACSAFSYRPAVHAPVVARLLAAGALVIGKTNMDQFAAGLVGVRSPYGIPRNLFDARYIVGGSSSGSAVAVAAGLVSFALGTDTAGSGRVPAAFNNIVGLKPTRGVLPTTGVVPACRSLDCVSVFALTCEDAAAVATAARGPDDGDPFARPDAARIDFAPGQPPAWFRFAVPAAADLDFAGDARARAAFAATVADLSRLGGQAVEVDFAPFREAAAFLYEGPFVAERLEAAGDLLARMPAALVPVLRAILADAGRWDARAAFAAQARLRTLQRRAAEILAGVEVLMVPAAPTIYRIDQVQADPLALNATLGIYASFVNLLDLCGVAVPGGFRDDGLPAGVTLIGPAGADARVAALATRLHRATSTTLGATGHALPALADPVAATATATTAAPGPGWLALAVAGAHLSGQPLNHQLTGPGGRLLRRTRTAPAYRLFALPGTTPPKPGLVRVPDGGVAIEVEVWLLPAAAFGAFVARIPAPLCIGSVELADATRVSGFLCEGHALAGARDISSFGGWRRFRNSSLAI